MSSISSVNTQPTYTPTVQAKQQTPLKQQPETPVVAPIAKDTDGDTDNSKGGKIDMFV